jgi:hypothetical protein
MWIKLLKIATVEFQEDWELFYSAHNLQTPQSSSSWETNISSKLNIFQSNTANYLLLIIFYISYMGNMFWHF